MFRFKYILVFLLFSFLPYRIFSLELEFPLLCNVGEDCYIQYYFNHNPGLPLQDYRCGVMSTPNQKGTSIRLSDTNEMIKGFEVLAANEGRVLSIQNSIPDQILNEQVKKSLKGNLCGNTVVLDHGNGWRTQYCHLMKDSVIVEPGEYVESGQPLGLLGLSGFTTYPHLEFILQKDDQFIDPFHSLKDKSKCGKQTRSLWKYSQEIPYSDSIVISSNFSETLPKLIEVVLGNHSPPFLTRDIKRLVFWVQIIGAKKGDIHSILITNQEGKIIAQSVKNILVTNEAVGIFSIVHNIGSGKFKPGLYKGNFVVERDSNGAKTIIEQHANQILLK